MRTKKLCFAIIPLCLILALVVTAFFVSAPKAVEATQVEFNGSEIKTEYVLGDTATFPDSITVSYNGSDYTATDGTLTYPSRKTMLASSNVLDESGQYTVTYYFDVSGVHNKAIKKFTVKEKLYTLPDKNGSTIEVSSASNHLSAVSSNVDGNVTYQDGIIVTLKDGDTFYYNKPLDLRELHESGLKIIDFDARTVRNVNGNYLYDVENTVVRLTDCYDPSVYIEFYISRDRVYSAAGFAYLRAGADNQDSVGLVPNVAAKPNNVLQKDVTVDGAPYCAYYTRGGSYGTNIDSVMGTGFQWSYDYDTGRIYAAYKTSSNGGKTFNSVNRLITDVYDADINGTGSLFRGFTTGEVFLSVRCEDYGGAEGRVEILSIGDMDGVDLKSMVTEGLTFADDRDPQVTIEAKTNSDGTLFAAVGDKFPIPSARVIDVNSNGKADVKVYRGYGTEKEYAVAIVGGKFDVAYNDSYTIVYTAVDRYGKTGSAELKVYAMPTADGRSITLDIGTKKTLTAGCKVTLDTPSLSDLNECYSGDVYVKIYAVHESETVEVDMTTLSFTPQYSGKYEIRYEYGDGLFEYAYSYEVVSGTESGYVSFMDKPVLPKYLVKGDKYKLDEIFAYKYDNGYPEKVSATPYISFDGAAPVEIQDLNAVKITGSVSARLLFKSGNVESEFSDAAPIVDVAEDGGIRMKNYFVGDFTAKDTDDETGNRVSEIKYTTNVSSGNAKLSFINPVAYRTFSFTYRILTGEANFDALRLTLTGKSYGETLTVEITNEVKPRYSINGSALDYAENFTFTGTGRKVISYTKKTNRLFIGSYGIYQNFEFKDELFYLDIEFVNVTGASTIAVNQVNNQTISGAATADNTAPEIIGNNTDGEYALNEVLTIRVPVFYDVLSQIDYSSVSFMVRDETGAYLTSEDGVKLNSADWSTEHRIKLSSIGRYFVSYTVKDTAGRSTTMSYTVVCVDKTAPVITVTSTNVNATMKVKVGATVSIKYTVTDDLTSADKISTYVHLFDENAQSYRKGVGDTFVADKKGNFSIVICAVDEAGNLATVKIALKVE